MGKKKEPQFRTISDAHDELKGAETMVSDDEVTKPGGVSEEPNLKDPFEKWTLRAVIALYHTNALQMIAMNESFGRESQIIAAEGAAKAFRLGLHAIKEAGKACDDPEERVQMEAAMQALDAVLHDAADQIRKREVKSTPKPTPVKM